LREDNIAVVRVLDRKLTFLYGGINVQEDFTLLLVLSNDILGAVQLPGGFALNPPSGAGEKFSPIVANVEGRLSILWTFFGNSFASRVFSCAFLNLLGSKRNGIL
jgi:hypothetical protein